MRQRPLTRPPPRIRINALIPFVTERLPLFHENHMPVPSLLVTHRYHTRHRWFVSMFVAVAIFSGCERPSQLPEGVVGTFGSMGLAPGQFAYPRAITEAPSGDVLVVDKAGRVQRFDATGHYLSEWVMPETAQGKPVGLAVHPDGRIFVADTHYHRVCIFDSDGHLLDTFGHEGTGDGAFLLPTDVAFDQQGFIYVSEYQGNDRITKWSPDLEFVGVIGAEPIQGLRLSRPAGIEIDDEQTLWVADACNHRVVRFSLEGAVLTTFGGFGRERGKMRYPYDIAVTPEGTILVCEYEGNRLQWFSKDGTSLRVWGEPGRRVGTLHSPWGATCGTDKRVYIVDSENYRVQIIKL